MWRLILSAFLPVLAAPYRAPRVLPFTLDGGRIYLPVSVGGHRTEFLLDTGAAPCVIEIGVARQFNVNLGEVSGASGVGSGSTPVAPVTQGSVTVAGTGQEFSLSTALDLSELAHYEGRRMPGIVGLPFFRANVVQIDYDAHQIRVFSPGAYEPSSRAAALNMSADNGRLLVDMKLVLTDGRVVPARCQLDTGALGTLLISTPYGARSRLNRSAPQYSLKRLANGVGGGSPGVVCRVQAIKIGRWSFNRPTVRVSTATTGMLSNDSPRDALIGYELLRRFRITIDTARHKVYLEPSKAFADPFPVECAGILPRAEQPGGRTYVVEEVVAKSPAQRAGVRIDDEIVALDGTPASSLSYHDLVRRLGSSAKRMRLTLRRSGKTVKVLIDRHPLI